MAGKYLKVQVKSDMTHACGTKLTKGMYGKVQATSPSKHYLVKFDGVRQPLDMRPDEVTIVGRSD